MDGGGTWDRVIRRIHPGATTSPGERACQKGMIKGTSHAGEQGVEVPGCLTERTDVRDLSVNERLDVMHD